MLSNQVATGHCVKNTEMTQLTAGDLKTLEYQTVRELSDKLRTGIQNDLVGIVAKVFSAEIISEDERRAITDAETHEAANVRADRFMTVLLDKIKVDPKCFGIFRKILVEEPAHKRLVDIIDQKLEELKKTRQMTPKQQTATVHNQPAIVRSQGANSLNQNHFPVKSTSMEDDCTFQSQRERHLITYKAEEIASNNLPHFPGPFVGRDTDVSNITTTLLSNHSPVKMVHIFGLPAVGKSTLAVHVGYKMASHRVAVRYINVDESHLFKSHKEPKPSDSIKLTESHTQKATQAVTSPKAFTEFALSWYSHTEKSFVPTTAQGLAEWAKGLSNATLLILDNCDILLQGMEGRKSDFISLLDSLNKASPYLWTVTTSRLKVQLLDAKPYNLKPLDNNSAIELLQLVSPTMTLNESKTINELLDGIPLALKIVGSLVNEIRPPKVIIAKLQQNLIQTLSPEDVRPEIQKMRPVLRLSFKYLDNGTQYCALYLSHFPGSFSQEAAMNILNVLKNNTPLDCLNRLTITSLLGIYFYAGQTRYQFHTLIKEYLTDTESRNIPYFVTAMNVLFNSSFVLHYAQALHKFVTIYHQPPRDEENIGRFEYENHNFECLLQKVHLFNPWTVTPLLHLTRALTSDLMLEIFTITELLKVGQRTLILFEGKMDDISRQIGALDTLTTYRDLLLVLRKWIQSFPERNCKTMCEETFLYKGSVKRVAMIDKQLAKTDYKRHEYYRELQTPCLGESVCFSYCLEYIGLYIDYAMIVGFLGTMLMETVAESIRRGYFTLRGHYCTVCINLLTLIFLACCYIALIYDVSTSIFFSVYTVIVLCLRDGYFVHVLKMMMKHEGVKIYFIRVSYYITLCALLICAFRKHNMSVTNCFLFCALISSIVNQYSTNTGAIMLHISSLVFVFNTYIYEFETLLYVSSCVLPFLYS